MNSRKWWLIALLLCLGVATISPLASSSPDGLERVAEDQGFLDLGLDPRFEVIPDYVFPGVENEALATILAGWIGTLLLFALGYGMGWIVRARRSQAVH